jgi:hypothetical protein
MSINDTNNTDNINNFDMSKFNDFVNNANAALSCDADCQAGRNQDDLKQKYLAAKTNLLTAPAQVQTTFKNYLTYSQGEDAYNQYNETELENKAKEIVKTFKTTFQEKLQDIKLLLGTYEGLLLNFTNIVDLYSKLLKENKMLALEVKNKSSDVLTNDRKTYYEDQSVENLYFYYFIMIILYIIILIVFAVSIFIFPSDTPRKTHIIMLAFLIIYPFISTWLLLFVIRIYNRIIGVLPTNVYHDL